MVASLATTHLLGIVIAIYLTQSYSFVATRSNIVRPGGSSHVIRSTNNDDLSELTVVDLKDRLRLLKLPLGGRKDELVQRLQEYSDEGLDKTNKLQDSALYVHSNPTIDKPDKLEDSASDMYSNLTVVDLKERLKKLGLSVGGRKADLIKRLVDFESNENTESKYESSEQESVTDDDIENVIDDIRSEQENVTDDDMLPIEKAEYSRKRRAKRKKFWKTQEVRELIKANDPSAVAKAEEMISWLERMALEEKDDEYLPGPIQYTTLIEAYSHSGTVDDAGQRAEKVINRLLSTSDDVSPTTPMLNAIIGAYASMGTESSAEQATSILERMEYIKDQGDGTVKPSVHSFGIVINAWSNVGTDAAASNAEKILTRLLEDYDEALENDVEYANKIQPNNVVFNSVIDSWARTGNVAAGEKAEAILHRMEGLSRMPAYDVRPDTITFNTCIKAWCNSGHVKAPFRAESLLKKLEANPQYPKQRGGMLVVRPNRLSFNAVINAWAKSRQPKAAVYAENLLIRMIKAYQSDPFSTVKPDAITFSSVLNALAKSKAAGKAEKCKSVLNSMITLHEDDGSTDTKPNAICYNSVLNACAFSAHGSQDGRRQALSVAVETFNELRNGRFGVSPDAVSYGNMLKCCANLMPPGSYRTKMASQLFTSCCNEGMVGGMCLDEIRRAIPPKDFVELLAKCGYSKPLNQGRKAHSVQLKHLPRGFTCNVKASDLQDRQRHSFAPEKSIDHGRQRRKEPPVLRRPGLLIEQSWMSGKDV